MQRTGQSISLFMMCILLLSCTSQEGARVEAETTEFEQEFSKDSWQQELLLRVEVLSSDSLEGREFASNGGALARQYLVDQFEQNGLALLDGKRTQSFGHDSKEGFNIVGEIRSTSLSDSAKTVLIGAHYDHVGIKGGKVFNGADDNASGTSLILAIADTLRKTTLKDIRFVFVAFDAEEKGLVGAKNFVKDNPLLVEKIDLMINFDMVSISETEELYVAGTHHNPDLQGIVKWMQEVADYNLLTGHDDDGGTKQDWTFSSDHGPFHLAKTPFLYFGVEDHKHYHQASDEYAVIDKEFYIRVAESFRQVFPQLESLL